MAMASCGWSVEARSEKKKKKKVGLGYAGYDGSTVGAVPNTSEHDLCIDISTGI
jgi:hypothetical protein